MKEYLLLLFAGLVGFFSPAFALIFGVGFFIVFDTIMGLYASWKMGRPILSRKLSRLISKITFYTVCILLVYTFDVLIISQFIENKMLITKIGAGALMFVEIFSIDEKLRELNNQKGFVFYITKIFNLIKTGKDNYNKLINKQ